jgi:hypothetical protein
MARAQNFFYRGDADLPAVAGASLGRALFGDPTMAAAQQKAQSEAALRAAQTGEATAHGSLYGSQDLQQQQETAGSRQSAGAVSSFFPEPVAPPAPEVGIPGGPQPAASSAPQPDAFHSRAGLGNLISGLLLAQGKTAKIGDVAGALSAFTGTDAEQRAGLIAQGHTPGKEFAGTSDRADQIAATEAADGLHKALGVANIAAAAHVAGENISAGASRYGSDQRLRGENYATDSRLTGTEYSADSKGSGGRHVALDGFNPGGINDGAFAKAQPGYAGSNGRYAAFKDIQSGEAAQATLLRGYIRGGYDTPQKIADRWAPAADGNDPVKYAQSIARTLGIGVNDKLSPDDVERFQQAQGRAENVAYVPKKTPSNGPAPKTVNSTMSTLLTKEMDKQLGEQGLDTNGDASARTMTALNGLAAQYFGKSGNHVQAVTQAIADFRAQHGTGADLAGQAAGRTRQTASAQPTRPPAQGARQAPNGLWYVVRGKKPDGSPQYFRVDG